MARTLEHIGSDEVLLFSTDYPHWHFDGEDALPDGLPAETMRRMLVDNPLETYPRLAGATRLSGNWSRHEEKVPMNAPVLQKSLQQRLSHRRLRHSSGAEIAGSAAALPAGALAGAQPRPSAGICARGSTPSSPTRACRPPASASMPTRPMARPPGSDLPLMRKQHLDPNGVEVGMLVALARGGMEEQQPGFRRRAVARGQ